MQHNLKNQKDPVVEIKSWRNKKGEEIRKIHPDEPNPRKYCSFRVAKEKMDNNPVRTVKSTVSRNQRLQKSVDLAAAPKILETEKAVDMKEIEIVCSNLGESPLIPQGYLSSERQDVQEDDVVVILDQPPKKTHKRLKSAVTRRKKSKNDIQYQKNIITDQDYTLEKTGVKPSLSFLSLGRSKEQIEIETKQMQC